MSEFVLLFQRNYKILKFFGIFLNDDYPKWLAYFRITLSYAIHVFMVFQSAYDLYLVRNDLSKVMLNVSMTGLISGVLLRNFLFLSIQQSFVEMHGKVFSQKHFVCDSETKHIIDQTLVSLKRLTKFFIALISLAMPNWLLMPLLSKEQFALPFRAWFPFEVTKYPHFLYAYGMQAYYIIYIGVSILCCDLMSYNILFMTKTHYTILAKNIRKIDGFLLGGKMGTDTDRVNMKNYLRELINHHQQIIRFINEYEELCSPIFVIQIYGGTALVASLTFEIFMFTDEFTSKSLAESFLCGGAYVNLFTFCFFGTILEFTSYNISHFVYGVKWYEAKECESLLKTFIILLVCRSQRPQRLTAGKMTPVNFPIFLSISEMIYNMTALFRQIANKHG